MKYWVRKFLSILLAALLISTAFMPQISALAGGDTEDDFFEEETPANEGYEITVIGGNVSFVNKTDEFTGRAFYGDVLKVELEPKEGRTFLQWESVYGPVVRDQSFTMYVAAPELMYPVFEDTDSCAFGEWEVVYDRGCIEGVLYRAVNTAGDVKYKLERRHSHDFEYIPVDDEYHVEKCTICGHEEEPEEHYFSSWNDEVIKEPTHDAPGEIKRKCDYCGYETIEYTDATDVHDWGPWVVTEASVNGQYGKRTRSCKYCNESESVWYLAEPDFKTLFMNHYFTYQADVGSQRYYENYAGFTREDGTKVYLFGERWQTSNGRDGDRYWIWMYQDDEDPSTLDPVYLSCSASTSMLGAFRWAEYTKVYDFDGWIGVIDHPSGAACGAPIVLGNLMDSRDSKFQSWAGRWAEKFNALMVPVTDDPESAFITTTGEGYKWEKTGESTDPYASKIVYLGKDGNDQDQYAYYGGFDAVYYQMKVRDTGNSKYDYMTIDPNSGLTLRSWEPYSSFDVNLVLYQDIVSAEAYALLDEYEKQGVVSIDDLASIFRIQTWGNSAFQGFSSDFSFDVPDPLRAVRFLTESGVDYTVSAKNFPDYISQYGTYNPARIVYAGAAISQNYPEEYAITLTWNEENTNNQVFDRWEKWNFETQSWDVLSTEPSVKLNTYADPLTEATIVHAVSHKEAVIYHVAVENGFFTLDDDSTEYTSKDLESNTKIYLTADDFPNMYVDHWEDESGNTVESWGLSVDGDHTYHPVYEEAVYEVYVNAYDGRGKVYAEGFDSEDEDRYVVFEGTIGTEVRLSTTCDDEGFSFMGWYLGIYGKDELNPGMQYTLLSEETDYTYTIPGYLDGTIFAVWTDGIVYLGDPDVKVDGFGSFIMREANVFDYNAFYLRQESDPDGKELFMVNGYSSLMIRCYTGFSIIDDPTEGPYDSTRFRIRWNRDEEVVTEYAEVENDMGSVYHYLNGPEEYPDLSMEVLALLESGDVNGNTESASDDVVSLLYTMYFDENPAKTFVLRNDFNNNGIVDEDDAIYLMYNIAFPELYPID